MEDGLSIHEKYVEKPYVIRLYEQALEQGIERGLEQGIKKGIKQGIKKGIKKGMKKLLRSFIQKNPNLSVEEVATLCDVDIRLVRKVADVKK